MAVRRPFTGGQLAPPQATLALDISNYTGVPTGQDIQNWKALGIGLVIIECFPASYAQYAVQTQQMSACKYAQMPTEGYIYDYLRDSSWRQGCLDGLSRLSALRFSRVWADEEDTSPFSVGQRLNAIMATLTAITAAGYETGIYTGSWWWKGYLNNTQQFSQEPLWDSHYDGVASTQVFTPYGGWKSCLYKQYMGTSTVGGVGNVDEDVTS